MNGNNNLLDLVQKTAAFDREESTHVDKGTDLTFKRGEDGVLRSYDVKTGKEVGRIFEHGDDDIDTIEEV